MGVHLIDNPPPLATGHGVCDAVEQHLGLRARNKSPPFSSPCRPPCPCPSTCAGRLGRRRRRWRRGLPQGPVEGCEEDPLLNADGLLRRYLLALLLILLACYLSSFYQRTGQDLLGPTSRAMLACTIWMRRSGICNLLLYWRPRCCFQRRWKRKRSGAVHLHVHTHSHTSALSHAYVHAHANAAHGHIPFGFGSRLHFDAHWRC